MLVPADSAVSAQLNNWRELHPGTLPPGHFYHAMAQGQQLGIVLFGGVISGSLASDTWTFLNGNWQQKSPTTNPGPRYTHAMCYDPNRNVVVLFGGWGNGDLGDTWEWDGVDWTQRITANAPTPRFDSRMAFDQASGRVVLFGGAATSGQVSPLYPTDTWTYDGVDWRLEQPLHTPSPRQAPALASTPTGVLLFGGFSYSANPEANGELYADTWRWDGVAGDWVQLNPGSSPPPVFGAGAAYDSLSGNVVLFGGSSANWGGAELDTTWLWDGNTWSQAFPNHKPLARSVPVLVPGVAGGVVLFGGYDPATGNGFSDFWQFPQSGLLNP